PRPWIASSVLAGAILIAAAGFVFVSKSFLPAQLGSVFAASLNGPIAVPIEKVLEKAKELESRLKGIKELDNWTVSAGVGHSSNASIDFSFRIFPEFSYNQDILAKIRQEVRKTLSGVPGYTTRISEPADPLAGSTGRYQPLAVNIFGDDINRIRNIARRVRAAMIDMPGVTDVAPIQDEGLPEILFRIKPELAAHYGTNSTQIADTLITWVDGNNSNNFQREDDQIPIRVRLKDGRNAEPLELLAHNLYLKPNGAKKTLSIPVGNVVDMDIAAGPTVISRENRQRVMRIGANLLKGAALGDIVTDLQKKLDQIPLPKGYRTKIVGQNEQMNELFGNVIFALILGSVFIYMILASLFESLLHPISVMIAIPLAATGAVIALIATGRPIDLYSGIGMILLAGIVAKNSILLVDFAIQKVRSAQMDPMRAIRESAPIRLRPILMTSVAVIFGMIPVASGIGSGGAARQSLGIATIGGVISSTLLTLFVVPSLYIAIESFSKKTISFRQKYLKF
ncbi:MAG: efflux RND transporter permease subunit, partial [Oligoflexales bacterium]|nr:efflux RND transporter permease subunit [Oligoflexales bacterium]